MTDLRQAAQQAQEALREFGYHGSSPRWERTANALKAALAQPKQEPVACRFCHSEKGCWAWQCYSCGEIDDVQQPTPPATQQEPTPWRDMVVVTLVREGIDKHRARELADHFAAQRLWQGLTDDDWDKVGDMPDTFDQGAAWAAARLKERNT